MKSKQKDKTITQKEAVVAEKKRLVDEAQAALEEARMAVAKLREQQEAASIAAAKALEVVRSTEKEQQRLKELTSKYSDSTFWEKRYKDAHAASMQGKTADGVLAPTYEWYVSLKDVSHLVLKDIGTSPREFSSSVLVPGCGNSTLCEDLIASGFSKVIGLDYSESVITSMEQRANSNDAIKGKCSYLQANVCSMEESIKEKVKGAGLIFDKGTLDAIASNDGRDDVEEKRSAGSAPSKGISDAAAYMSEMWRVLSLNGLFIAVTTMPPDIFYTIAVSPLDPSCHNWEEGSSKKGGGKSQGTCCARQEKIKTNEGGEIYYYCLTKLAEPKAVGTSHRSGDAARIDAGREKIVSGINVFLDEAIKEMKKCEEGRGGGEGAEWDEGDGMDMSGGGGGGGTSQDVRFYDTDDDIDDGTTTASPPQLKSTTKHSSFPTVSISLDEANSNLIAGGKVEVEYELKNGEWSDDDFICLRCTCPLSLPPTLPPSTSLPMDTIASTTAPRGSPSVDFYKRTDPCPYECFEYVSAPPSNLSSGDARVQRVTLSLPPFGGIFQLSYIRSFMKEKKKVGKEGVQGSHCVKRHKILGSSATFSVNVNVSACHPDRPNKVQRNGVNDASSPQFHRRGTGSMNQQDQKINLQVLIEDLCSIKALLVSIKPPESNHTKDSLLHGGGGNNYLARVAVWAYRVSEHEERGDINEEKRDGVRIVVEADVVKLEPFSESNSHKKCLVPSSIETCYCSVIVDDHTLLSLFPEGTSQPPPTLGPEFVGQIEESGEGRFVCRFPYSSIPLSSTSSSSTTATTAVTTTATAAKEALCLHRMQSRSALKIKVACRFCSASLYSMKLKDVRSLPTGIFDSMMHEFICCEEACAQALTSSEIASESGLLLLGPTHALVHPASLLPASLTLECKRAPSLVDMIGEGGIIATSLPPIGLTESHPSSALLNIVDISTCTLLCSRCRCYVGDGQIGGDDDDDDIEDEDDESDRVDQSQRQMTISIDLLRDIKFSLNHVTFHCDPPPPSLAKLSSSLPPSILPSLLLSAEQATSRTLVHLSSLSGCSAFRLYSPDMEVCDTQNEASEMEGGGAMTISLRLMSKDCRYAFFFEDTSTDTAAVNTKKSPPPVSKLHRTPRLQPAVKVSFVIKEGNTKGKMGRDREVRVPLMYEDFIRIKNVLERRGQVMGKSIFKGEIIACLRL